MNVLGVFNKISTMTDTYKKIKKVLSNLDLIISEVIDEPVIIVNDMSLIHIGSDEASGIDIKSDGDHIIKPHETIFIDSGLRVQMPKGIHGDIRPRSGYSRKGIQAQLGLIDPDYLGSWGVLLYNSSNKDFVIEKGDRIGQIVFAKDLKFKLYEGEITKKTKRGSKGFGSTGK